MTPDRALFDRLPRLADLVPFVELADELPTPVGAGRRPLLSSADLSRLSTAGTRSASRAPVVGRRPTRRAGCHGRGIARTMSFPLRCTAAARARLEAVLYPQDVTERRRMTRKGWRARRRRDRDRQPLSHAARTGAKARRHRAPPAVLALAGRFDAARIAGICHRGTRTRRRHGNRARRRRCRPRLGRLCGRAGSWARARRLALVPRRGGARRRPLVTGAACGGLEAGTAALLAGRLGASRARIEIDGRWFGGAYGRPTEAGAAAPNAARGSALPRADLHSRRWPRR